MTPDPPCEEIAIRVHGLAQLFSPYDPSPLAEKDLASGAEAHILEWARELPRRAALAIAVELPAEEARRPEAREIGAAIANYFAARALAHAAELRELFRVGRLSLLIGLAALLVCLAASQVLAPLIPYPALSRAGEESLLLLGWVANWRPLEIYLYEWWPIRRRRLLCERLARARVTVRAS
ncbi:MAG TPA: hypothetical protein VFR34_13840 [Paracoccaceae bacterium]|nr:hypothetical protein [Paracoccaceae bacterium]